ncbi:MAG: hypothetical protein WBX15_04730 [Thermoanaerobaculia bacterium]
MRPTAVLRVLVLSLFIPLAVVAQTPIGSETQINAATAGDQMSPGVAVDGAGNFTVVWNDLLAGTIAAHQFDSTPASLGGDFQVSTASAYNNTQPSISMKPTGEFVVAWDRSSGYYAGEPVARVFSANGTPVTGEITIASTYTSFTSSQPRAAMDGSGNFVVSWNDPYGGIKAGRFDSGGNTLVTPFVVSSYASTSYPSAVATDSTGNFVVVWEEYTSGSSDDVWAARYDPNGVIQPGSPFMVNTYTTDRQLLPAVSMDASGNFVVVWASRQFYGAQYDIFGQRFDSTGAQVGGEFQVNQDTSYDENRPAVALDSGGHFVVVWNSSPYALIGAKSGGRVVSETGSPRTSATANGGKRRAQMLDGSGSGIGGIVFDGSSVTPTPIGSDFMVNTYTTNGQVNPSVSLNDQGRFVVTWQSYGQDGSGNGTFGQAFAIAIPCPAAFTSILPANASTVPSSGTLSWATDVAADTYDVLLQDSLGGTITPPTQTGLTTTSVAYSGLAPGTYSWTVTANKVGCNPISSTQSFTVPTCPTSFTSISPADTSTVPSSGTLSWATDAPADTYDLVLKDSLNNVITPPSATGLTATSANYSGLAPGTYSWTVTANKASCTPVSSTQSFTVPSCVTLGGFAPSTGSSAPVDGTLNFTATPAADQYLIYFGPAGSGCSILYQTISGTGGSSQSVSVPYANLNENQSYEWKVVAKKGSCSDTISACMTFTTQASCPSTGPALFLPAPGSTVQSPVEFFWSPVGGATSYRVWVSVDGGSPVVLATTNDLKAIVAVPAGDVTWWVEALLGTGCPAVESAHTRVIVSGAPPPPPPCGITGQIPSPAVVGTITSGEPYDAQWDSLEDAASYVIQESTTPNFDEASTSTFEVTLPTKRFIHSVTVNTPFWYRVAARPKCDPTQLSAYSDILRIVIEPPPPPNTPPGSGGLGLTTQNGNTNPVNTTLFIPGTGGSAKNADDGGSTFGITTSTSWVTVNPSSGALPPTGTTVTVTANPTGVQVGTNTSTVGVTTTTSTGQSTTTNVPVSLTLVTPANATAKPGSPPANALLIPAVAHVEGGNDTQWVSDVRITNTSINPIQYLLSYTRSRDDGTLEGKQTKLTINPGLTIAFDDVVKTWYGVGALNDGANGTLEIRPLNASGKNAADGLSLATVATSRTYNRSAAGTFGQFIPGVPIAKLIGKTLGDGAKALLSMQQISQGGPFRTNFGIVEGSGQPATAMLSVFDNGGAKLGDFTIPLKPFEHVQLNSYLAEQGISVADGRAEVSLLSDTGKVMSYASVVDGRTGDPMFIPGTNVAANKSDRYVLAGVADFNTEIVHWRSDVRLFNGGTSPVTATITFYPQDSTEPAGSVQVTVAPGEVKALDDVLGSVFGETNTGGMLQITTPSQSSLVVTGRTYNKEDSGTYGQFIQGVTPADAVGAGERALQITQVEQSDRFRTNLGIAEVSGSPVTVEIQAIVPNTKATPKITVQLGANEFEQLNAVLTDRFNLSDVYNARISVKVVGGSGRILAYGSAVDNKTQDPTYIPAQ